MSSLPCSASALRSSRNKVPEVEGGEVAALGVLGLPRGGLPHELVSGSDRCYQAWTGHGNLHSYYRDGEHAWPPGVAKMAKNGGHSFRYSPMVYRGVGYCCNAPLPPQSRACRLSQIRIPANASHLIAICGQSIGATLGEIFRNEGMMCAGLWRRPGKQQRRVGFSVETERSFARRGGTPDLILAPTHRIYRRPQASTLNTAVRDQSGNSGLIG
jgi:hypothetical protein